MTVVDTISQSAIPKVDYIVVPIKSISLIKDESSTKQVAFKAMNIDGVDGIVHFTNRFINSFGTLFGVSNSTYNLFSYDEIVSRLIIIGKADRVRIALQKNKDGSHTALSVIKPTKGYVESFDLWEMLAKMDVNMDDLTYKDGVVRSVHSPSYLGKSNIEIGGESIARKFCVDVPIDGYGSPSSYLMMFREVCSNGAIAEGPVFRSTVNLGDTQGESIPSLRKYIESFNNEEGFHILKSRLESAHSTTASINEFIKLSKALPDNNFIKTTLENLAGRDIVENYGLVNLDQLSYKKKHLLPCKCSVMDLINVASEVATHKTDLGNKKVSTFIGAILSSEFDLEGADFGDNNQSKDFYIN